MQHRVHRVTALGMVLAFSGALLVISGADELSSSHRLAAQEVEHDATWTEADAEIRREKAFYLRSSGKHKVCAGGVCCLAAAGTWWLARRLAGKPSGSSSSSGP